MRTPANRAAADGWKAAVVCASLAVTCANAGADGEPTFLDLGTGRATGISADGSVVVGFGAIPWRWEGGVFTDLGTFPNATEREVWDVSADGRVVIGRVQSSTHGIQGFRWTAETGIQGLGWLPTSELSIARAVSGDGSTIVGQCFVSSLGYRAFRWTALGGMEDLGPFDAYGVSADGSVIAGFSNAPEWPNPYIAWRWTESEGHTALGVPEGTDQSNARAVSADGSTIVGVAPASNFGTRAFRWTAETGIESLGTLPLPGSPQSAAFAVSADGSVIVGSSGWGDTDFLYGRAFRWTESGGMEDLMLRLQSEGVALDGWNLGRATAVSADGNTIAGDGTYMGVSPRAWLVRLKPEPQPCAADHDGNGDLSVTDIFAFLTCWFAGDVTCANFNADCCINVGDIFDFLTAWFAGCP